MLDSLSPAHEPSPPRGQALTLATPTWLTHVTSMVPVPPVTVADHVATSPHAARGVSSGMSSLGVPVVSPSKVTDAMGTVASASPLMMEPEGTVGAVASVPGVPCSTVHSTFSTSVGADPLTSLV